MRHKNTKFGNIIVGLGKAGTPRTHASGSVASSQGCCKVTASEMEHYVIV